MAFSSSRVLAGGCRRTGAELVAQLGIKGGVGADRPVGLAHRIHVVILEVDTERAAPAPLLPGERAAQLQIDGIVLGIEQLLGRAPGSSCWVNRNSQVPSRLSLRTPGAHERV